MQPINKTCTKEQEVNTCINCEHSYRHMNDHLNQNTGRMQRQHLQHFSHAEFLPDMENTPAFLGKQFLQGKEKITCPDMENIPALLWNQSIQGNEKNVDTCAFTPGNTTTGRHYAQHTHTLKESSTEFPTTGEGKFQHSGTSRLQPQC